MMQLNLHCRHMHTCTYPTRNSSHLPSHLPITSAHHICHLLTLSHPHPIHRLALFSAQWGTENGGLVRVLCGIGEDGEPIRTAEDAINIRSEIEASQARKLFITLPDDEDPTNEKGVEWCLILSITLISLDWLANGAFGPFAESVSATHPCFKCMWTDSCGCSWIARSDSRNQRIQHSTTCCRRRLRSHDETMRVVREMRELSSTKLKATMTAEGIFSTLFASQYLLKDVVKDPCVDIMHVFFASGVVTYTLSWLFDELIPDSFSWEQLNAAVKKENSRKQGSHIPKLRRSGNTSRSAAKLPLTASESMAFSLARCMWKIEAPPMHTDPCTLTTCCPCVRKFPHHG